MELKGVGSITMGHFLRETLWEVDDLDGIKWASLCTHTATDAQWFRYKANGGCRGYFNAYFPCFVDWACFFTFLLTFLRFALIRVDNGNSQFFRFYHII